MNEIAFKKAGSNPVTSASGRFEPGVVLEGTYRILRSLAVGGMGEVYLATHERLHGAFAVKVLHGDFSQDEEALFRFRCEAEIMAGLRHPNIVQVFDFNVTPDGIPYLVMELIEGRDLGEHLRGNRPLAPARVARIVRQIASALEAAHAQGVVHRDLKPENVMMLSVEGQEDFIKVVDFGISKSRSSERITSEMAVLGTPQFMAPEQAQGRRDEVDARTDQFALASMTYTLLTGREPFSGDTGVAVLYQVVHQDPEPIGNHVDWPCAYVDAVLRRGMAKDREARFDRILDFARALEEAIARDMASERNELPVLDLQTPLSMLPVWDSIDRRRPSTTLTVCHRRHGRPRRSAVGRMLGAIAVAALAFYLASVGPDTVGSAFGVAYRTAVATASRTISRFTPGTTPSLMPSVPQGSDMAPLADEHAAPALP